MASGTTTIFMTVSPLITADAAALDSDILARGLWQPTHVVRSDPTELAGLDPVGVTTSGDIWTINLALPNPMPGYTFLPITLTAAFTLGVIGSSFWNLDALYSIVPPVGVAPLQNAWRSFQLDTVRTVFNGAVVIRYQTAAPVFQGYPPASELPATTGIAAIGGFQFTVGTFDAGEEAAIALSVAATWLAFPVSITRSAGFYVPRLFFKTN